MWSRQSCRFGYLAAMLTRCCDGLIRPWSTAAVCPRPPWPRPCSPREICCFRRRPSAGQHAPGGEPRTVPGVGDITWAVRTVLMLGWAASRAGELDRSVGLREQAVALAREEEDQWNLAMALGNLGGSLWKVGDYARARAALEESLLLYRSLGELEGTAFALCGLGMLTLSEGDHKQASSLLGEALALARKVGHLPDTGRYLADLGVVVLHEAEYDRAAALFEESLRIARQVEDELLPGECLWGMAAVAAAQGRPVRAACLGEQQQPYATRWSSLLLLFARLKSACWCPPTSGSTQTRSMRSGPRVRQCVWRMPSPTLWLTTMRRRKEAPNLCRPRGRSAPGEGVVTEHVTTAPGRPGRDGGPGVAGQAGTRPGRGSLADLIASAFISLGGGRFRAIESVSPTSRSTVRLAM